MTYHTCGGTLGIEDSIVRNGADASETLAPISIGAFSVVPRPGPIPISLIFPVPG